MRAIEKAWATIHLGNIAQAVAHWALLFVTIADFSNFVIIKYTSVVFNHDFI